MATRHRTVLRQEVAFLAGDTAIIDDLPVNPLSFIDITIRALNNGANAIPPIADILNMLTNIEVLFKGSSLIAVSATDLFVLQHRLRWLASVPQPRSQNDNDIFRLTLRLSFSRKPWWVSEGFPASRRGELQLRLTPAATFTGIDGASLNVETEEILDGAFKQFLKYTTLNRTPTATGESDVDLPIGNPVIGVLLFGTTVPTAAAVTASMREVRFLLDNQEVYVPKTRWDTLHANLMQDIIPYAWLSDHTHRENTGGVYAQNANTAGPQNDNHAFNNHAYLDFDPLKDGAYFVQTAGRSRVHLRINADVADAQRIVPVEMIELAPAAGAA